MSEIQQFEDLDTWQKAREFTRIIYEISSSGKFAKDVGLRDQIRRSSVSVLSNISEGFERGGNKEFIHFLSIAKGSCGEIRAQLYIALDQEYITEEVFQNSSDKALELSRMISGFIKYLKDSPLKGNKYK
ncbi:MAG TPA: four helix bundle protein [bacterium]|nr:four helix bundle protein [bacterium]